MEPVKERKTKGGRPRQMIVRQRTTGVRFSATEYFIVQAKAKKAGLKITTFIRQAAVDGKIKTRLTENEQVYVRDLIGQSRNINQIAKACHTEGVLKALLYFENIRSQIDEILLKLKS